MINDSILVVVDMLYDFIDGSLACMEAEKAVANTAAFIEKTQIERRHMERALRKWDTWSGDPRKACRIR